jgi:hypothetical protein
MRCGLDGCGVGVVLQRPVPVTGQQRDQFDCDRGIGAVVVGSGWRPAPAAVAPQTRQRDVDGIVHGEVCDAHMYRSTRTDGLASAESVKLKRKMMWGARYERYYMLAVGSSDLLHQIESGPAFIPESDSNPT